MYYMLINLFFSGLFFGVLSAVVSLVISPLQFVKVMRQSTYDIYYNILVKNMKRGGIWIFFRGAVPYAMMNFYSSMSFGFAEEFSKVFGFMTFSLIWSSIARSLLGGLFETLMSLHAEIIEISKNKGVAFNMKVEYVKLFFPVLIRNAIFWNSAILAYELGLTYSFSPLISFCVAIFLGALFGVISIPFDIIATRICADSRRIGGIKAILYFFQKRSSSKKSDDNVLIADGGNVIGVNKDAKHQKYNGCSLDNVRNNIFSGLSIRLVQVIIFSFTTTVTIEKYDVCIQYLSGLFHG